jgi:multidrug resistance protein, MATE family
MFEYLEDEETRLFCDEKIPRYSDNDNLLDSEQQTSYKKLCKTESADGHLNLWPEMSTVDIAKKFTALAMPSIFSCFLT